MSDALIKRNNLAEVIVTWAPVGPFIGLAKDSSAVEVRFREDGGQLDMSADGIFGTLYTDNDYSASAVVKLDESSPTYGLLMSIYQRGKGVTAPLVIVKGNGEIDTLDCAFIMDMGAVTDGYRAQNFREVTFHGARRNFNAKLAPAVAAAN